MPPISKDNVLYFFTAVTLHRLPVFRTETLRRVLAQAFNEARASSGFKILAYVLMPDHYHLITDSTRKASEILRYLNGISARRVIDHLKENSHESSLSKLRRSVGSGDHKYSLWEHHSNTFLITTETMLMKKAHYIHQNPVEEGLVKEAFEYTHSSFRFWSRSPLLNDEPIEVDLGAVTWRQSRYSA